MKKEIVAIGVCAILLLVIFSSGCIKFGEKEKEEETYLLVETIAHTGTALVSGNYTDGTLCIDFPTYSIDEGNKTLHHYMGSEQENFKLVYGSGELAGGIMKTGGATGLTYINDLPFFKTEKISMGNTYFNITITITENFEVYINDTYLLSPGTSINYTYDFEDVYQNRNSSNETCVIRYSGNTRITNYGIWKKSMIEFGN
ncbi:MAG: hypothetical protein QMC80_02785 [Thermoplasmatales archaeon]|nr:hypothetical protein [Thermoplasmatales archaeon]